MSQQMDRRGFLRWLIGGLVGVVVGLVGIPAIGYIFAPWTARKRPTVWARVTEVVNLRTDAPTEFAVDFTSDGEIVERRAVYAIRNGNEVVAYSNLCTHMGCPTLWIPTRGQIVCPCHGGIYDRYGNLVGGPPPHNLYRFVHTVQNGVLYVRNIDDSGRGPGV